MTSERPNSFNILIFIYMSSTFLRIQYGIFGFLALLIPSIILSIVIKYDLNINIPFVLFLAAPVYLSYVGFRYGASVYRKALSNNLTGFFIISLMYFFGGIVLIEYKPSELLSNTLITSILALIIYFFTIYIGIKIGNLIASHDKTIDMDTESDKMQDSDIVYPPF
jgi:hypothetical protein